MSVQALVDRLSTQGVTLALHSGQIKARGPKGAVTADLVQCLRSNKVQILKFLTDSLLNRAANAATVEGAAITASDLYAALDPEDWQDPDLITFDALKGLGRAIQNRRGMLAGHIPAGWTATTRCSNCSKEVPTFPGGSGEVLACVRCMNGQAPPPLPGGDK